jgi:hypothetical protein
MREVTAVLRGVHTPVLLRAGLVDPSCCLSLITPTRSLDLTLPNSIERDRVVRGLEMLLENRPKN